MIAELNEPQRLAVAHEAGPLLIFAGAGSGKTRTITYRIANLLATHRVPPYRILAVTFTNKAAGEMRARLQQLAGEEVTRDLWVGTFHSICARLLRRYHDDVGLTRSFVIYDEADQKAVLGRILKELGLDERRFPPKFVLSRIHAQKREGLGPDEVGFDRGFDDAMIDLYERYQRALATANAVDFEDLILHATRIAEDPNSDAGQTLRGRFSHVLVDEFQDTNLMQYRLVRALSSSERNLCVVGDDDQSIYRWRGANVRIIRGFKHDFADACVIKLEQNYRSTSNIVAAALGVIKPALEREPKQLWTAQDPGSKVLVRACRDERDEAAHVVRSIARAQAQGIAADEMAVFYRVHAQSRVLEEALRGEGLPYQIVGGMKFFERAEVKDLLAYLRLAENPHSDADLMRVINVPARGIGSKTVERLIAEASRSGTSLFTALPGLLQGSSVGSAAKKRLAAFKTLLEQIVTWSRDLSPSELAERILDETGYQQALRDADSAEADARLENLGELLGSLAEYEADAGEAGEAPSLSGYLERVALVAAVDTMRDVPAVSLMTVHSAKGLEFDAVWLTGMEEEVFPYRGLDGTDPEELDEERRLAYVAITRARRTLCITHAAVRSLFGQTRYLTPSRFLRDLPGGVVEQQGTAYSQRPAWRDAAAFGAGAPFRASPPQPVLAPGERTIDRSAFDDTASDEPGHVVRPGDRVLHKRFGRGIVQSVDFGAAPSVVARFPGYGTRKVLAEFLQFES